jgi:preprotein translocase subunit SecG
MNLQTLVSIFHVLLASSLIAIVLLQRGKGAEAGAAFGAGASGTVFGSKGSASFLSRTTAVLAALFFATSLTLAYLSGQQEGPVSILEAAPGAEDSADEVPGILVPDDDVDLPALPAEQAVVEEEETPGSE